MSWGSSGEFCSLDAACWATMCILFVVSFILNEMVNEAYPRCVLARRVLEMIRIVMDDGADEKLILEL